MNSRNWTDESILLLIFICLQMYLYLAKWCLRFFSVEKKERPIDEMDIANDIVDQHTPFYLNVIFGEICCFWLSKYNDFFQILSRWLHLFGSMH